MRRSLSLLAAVLLTAPLAAAPPVTNLEVPPPGPAQAAAWAQAVLILPTLDMAGPNAAPSEAARMLLAVHRGETLAPGVGWFGPARKRHDWKWLASQCDANRDGRITGLEFDGPTRLFRCLDRDRNGAITEADLDWSEESPWVRQEALALRLFRAIDADGNGRATEAEWQAYMKKKAGEKDHLTPEDIRTALAESKPPQAGGRRNYKPQWIRTLFQGDLGSALEGPRPGQMAPDFTLPRQNGQGTITLSELRGQPVVLIFGSFT